MEFKSSTSLMSEILRQLKVEMNGAVVGSMEDRGLTYHLNYGVSLHTIKKIVKEYAPNHKLAKLLYQQQIRELQLAAIYIADPNDISLEVESFWAKGVVNSEIATNMGSMLVGNSVNCKEVVDVWLQSDNSNVVYSALIAISKAIKNGLIKEASEYIDVCTALLKSSDSNIWRGIELVLIAVAHRSILNKELVKGLLSDLCNSDLDSANYIYSEVSWQIEY